jgi:CheY-like chemotaxis protein
MSKYVSKADVSLDREDQRQAKILVIDDEEAVVRVLTQLLERAGYEVASTQSAKDGFWIQRENSADLIIMDIFMPDVNGLEAIQRLKKTYPDTPIFAISGGSTMAGRDCLELAQEKGADYAFRKPFKAAEFVAAIGDALT